MINVLLVASIALSALPAAAGPSEAELKKKFEARYPEIRQLKQKGIVGETSDGYLDFVSDGKKDDKAADLVSEENDDRKALYALIAEKEKTEPRLVAERNAKRNFERAREGEYLREDGKWRKKGDE
jgi:hypothetical protein